MSVAIHEERGFIPSQYIFRAYEEVIGNPMYSRNSWNDQLPEFDDMYEEIVMMVLESNTNMTRDEIDLELRNLDDADCFDVEKGFRPEEITSLGMLEVFNAILESGCAFIHNEEFYNIPLQEVW